MRSERCAGNRNLELQNEMLTSFCLNIMSSISLFFLFHTDKKISQSGNPKTCLAVETVILPLICCCMRPGSRGSKLNKMKQTRKRQRLARRLIFRLEPNGKKEQFTFESFESWRWDEPGTNRATATLIGQLGSDTSIHPITFQR